MKRSLLCVAGHAWHVRDGASVAPEVPRCPTCGAPPGLGSEIGWEFEPVRLAGRVFVASLPAVAFAGLIFLVAPEWEVGRWWKLSGVALLAAGYVLMGCLATQDGQRRLHEFVQKHRLRYAEDLSDRRLEILPDWELKGRVIRWDQAITGAFLGEDVLVCRVQLPGGKHPPCMTVVTFTDPIPGLPDFDLEPTNSKRLLSFSEIVQQWRNERRDFDGEPFARVYRLYRGEPQRLGKWLGRPGRNRLAQHPGWVIQARDGQLLVCQEYRVCPVEGLPTLLAVARHLHQIFLTAEGRTG